MQAEHAFKGAIFPAISEATSILPQVERSYAVGEFVLVPLHFSCLTNRFYVATRLFTNRSQMTSKCGKNKKVALELVVSLMFLPHSDVICDLLLLMPMKTVSTFSGDHW